MNLFDLTGKVAIVVGSSGNLGPIWCGTLRDAGADVVTLDFPSFDATSGILMVPYDVDILVYNAGVDNPPGSNATFFGGFRHIVDVNIYGAARMSELAVNSLMRNKGGVIVNIGSVMGSVGADPSIYPDSFEKPAAYNCSKSALAQLSRSITTQYGRYNIRSVTISFAGIDSPKWTEEFRQKYRAKIPMGRTPSVESLQRTLLYACCCDDVAGTEIIVDGGYLAL